MGNSIHSNAEIGVTDYLNKLFLKVIKAGASDLHFEPQENTFLVRYRKDGILYDLDPAPKYLAIPVISRLKVLSKLNIAEKRTPQDGAIRFNLPGLSVDLRISTLPTQHGESAVLRILNKETQSFHFSDLGLSDDLIHSINTIITQPNGLFIATGPTGSGKTTTLYSALKAINEPQRKVFTVEDPVEYELEGVIQMATNTGIGLNFPTCLKALLRQDPDTIMVGEVRDYETAQMAIQASLTGHLVLTTLHAQDTSAAIARLIDIQIEPYLIADSLRGILAQRLVRSLCKNCRIATEDVADLVLLAPEIPFNPKPVYKEGKCSKCAQTGFKDRQGIFELMLTTATLKEYIAQGISTSDLRERARKEGMRTLREEALKMILRGDTSIDEVTINFN